MLVQPIQKACQPAHVVVLASEKGGSGKSTAALHIAVALLKAGQRVATSAPPLNRRYFRRGHVANPITAFAAKNG